MVFARLLLEDSVAVQPYNYEVGLDTHLTKIARWIPALSPHYIGKKKRYTPNKIKKNENMKWTS